MGLIRARTAGNPAGPDRRAALKRLARLGERQGLSTQKRQVDAAAANYPGALSDTEGFAEAARARIPASETAASAQDSSKAADDYAARMRNRATTPPPPN